MSRETVAVAVAVLAALTGCDAVFQLDRDFDAPTGDGASDGDGDGAIDGASQSAISALTLEAPIATGERGRITAMAHGRPGAILPYTFSVTRGTVDVPSGLIEILETNPVMIETGYTAPGTQVTEMVSATVDGAPAVLSFPVLGVSSFGFDQPPANTNNVSANQLFGTKIEIGADGYLREAGLNVVLGGTIQVRFGVYSNGASLTLLAELAPQALGTGRTVFPMPRVALPAGTYWLAAVFSATTALGSRPATVTGDRTFIRSHNFAAAMPASIPFSGTTYLGGTDHSMFLRIATP